MTMQEYWKKVKSEALDAMRRLIGQDVDDTCEDMRKALAYTLDHGTPTEASQAVDYYGDYKWAVHETKAHEIASSTPMKVM